MPNLENCQTKENYNRLPVYYCQHCGSLKILRMPQELGDDYCDECGSTSIGKASIEAWMKLQETTYKPLYKDKPVKQFNILKR